MLQKKNNGLAPYRSTAMGFWPSDFLPDFLREGWMDGTMSYGSPRVDIRETEKEYVIDAEFPGFAKDDVNISLDDNRLTISAKKEESSEEKDENGRYIRRERRSGAFQRSFLLENVDTGSIQADMVDGILHVTLPKEEPVVPASRKIEIR